MIRFFLQKAPQIFDVGVLLLFCNGDWLAEYHIDGFASFGVQFVAEADAADAFTPPRLDWLETPDTKGFTHKYR